MFLINRGYFLLQWTLLEVLFHSAPANFVLICAWRDLSSELRHLKQLMQLKIPEEDKLFWNIWRYPYFWCRSPSLLPGLTLCSWRGWGCRKSHSLTCNEIWLKLDIKLYHVCHPRTPSHFTTKDWTDFTALISLVVIVKHDVRLLCALECSCTDRLSSVCRELPVLQVVTQEHSVPGLDHLVHVHLADLGLHQAAALPSFRNVNNFVNCRCSPSSLLHFSGPNVERGVQKSKFKYCVVSNWYW